MGHGWSESSLGVGSWLTGSLWVLPQDQEFAVERLSAVALLGALLAKVSTRFGFEATHAEDEGKQQGQSHSGAQFLGRAELGGSSGASVS